MIELRGIGKYFLSNGVMALENAGLTLRPGEIHALLGENGTGKSTLMHILAGYFPPSSGTILVDGKERHFSAPADALALGIGMVRQNPGIIGGFKVWENCILGAENMHLEWFPPSTKSRGNFLNKCRGFFLDPAMARQHAEELSNQWNFDLPLNKYAETLTVSQRQKAAVLALLLRDIKWFIFDEPTAVLTPGESKNLFLLFGQLKGKGCGIIFITHKLDEALAVSDRITVIRHGKTGEPINTRELTPDTLKDTIFSGVKRPAVSVNAPGYSGEDRPVLEIKDLEIEQPGLPHIRNVNFKLGPGKIMGITGVRDSGLETLELAVAGFLGQNFPQKAGYSRLQHGTLKGSITLNGRDITGKGVWAFRDAGGAYLGADRSGSSLAPNLPLSESLIIHAYRRARRMFGIFLDAGRLRSWCLNIMNHAGIDRSVSDKASSFSGGMIQRILLAREFAEKASLLVLAEAGNGLDHFNRQKLFNELKTLTRHGSSVLLFSTDIEELISAADEIMLLRNGALSYMNESYMALSSGEIDEK